MLTPTKVLSVRQEDLVTVPKKRVLCPGFELKKLRIDRLADNLVDWLPDFAIRQDELPEQLINTSDFRRLMEQAAARLYKNHKPQNRGEIGELLLHIACREVIGTFPTISKVYYKTATNDVVKGFDLVHTKFDETDKKLELWLGEAKFYTDGVQAVSDAIKSIDQHLNANFLKAEKFLLGGKISSDTPGYSLVEWLFEKDTSLDEIFERLVVPILITYESNACSQYVDEISYDLEIAKQIEAFQKTFGSKLPKEILFHCFYVPLSSKEMLVTAFDKKLGAYS